MIHELAALKLKCMYGRSSMVIECRIVELNCVFKNDTIGCAAQFFYIHFFPDAIHVNFRERVHKLYKWHNMKLKGWLARLAGILSIRK